MTSATHMNIPPEQELIQSLKGDGASGPEAWKHITTNARILANYDQAALQREFVAVYGDAAVSDSFGPGQAAGDGTPFGTGPDYGYHLREIQGALDGGLKGEAIKFLKELLGALQKPANVPLVDAATWINADPPKADAVLHDTFDAGDKVPIIGSSKTRKTFFALQLALCIATGRDFLNLKTTKPRRVLFVQMEVTEVHFWRRVHNMARKLDVSAAEIGNRLAVANLRGTTCEPAALIDLARKHSAEVVVVDPIYKLLTGDENLAKDVKPLLASFDALTEETRASVVYVHHNPKGTAGDRDARDRGAGSGVIARDFDACLYLTEHRDGAGMIVVESLLRNYPPQDPFTIGWNDGKFSVADDVAPVLKTSQNRNASGRQTSSMSDDDAMTVVAASGPHTSIGLDDLLRGLRCGFSKRQAVALRDRLTKAGKLVTFTPKTFPRCVWYGTPGQIDTIRHKHKNPTFEGQK
jgi:hypothetical protein